jgi:2',3'-cyclic-nucleotide 2'-phosphodiesterase (5'-nucleotidase family)
MRLLLILLLAVTVGTAGVQHVYVLHTNDIHGALLPGTAFWMNRDFPPPLGNAAAALSLIRELRAEAEEKGYGFLLLDAGDVYRGAPVGDFTHGDAVIDYFGRAGYDAIGVGNYDYAEGLDQLQRLVESSAMPWTNANIHVAGTDTTPGFLVPHLVLERGGVKFGIFGLITSYNNSRIEDSVVGDMDVADERDVARDQVALLREAGADVVVGLTHIGHKYEKRLAENVPGIDLIIGGRSNTALREPVETPKHHTIVCQAASRLSSVGFLDLAIDTETRRIVGYEGRLITLFADEIPMDPEYVAYLDSLRALAEQGFDEVLGRCRQTLTREPLKESPAGNFVTDAMREYTGVDIALHNSTGIRKDVPEGELTYRDAYEIDGFGNSLVTGEYTGRQVREMLAAGFSSPFSIWQVSGVRLTVDRDKAFGQRVQSVSVAGEPLDPDHTYRVVTNSYLGGADGQFRVFRDGENVEDTNVPLRDAIADYVRRHQVVDARVEGRIAEVGR